MKRFITWGLALCMLAMLTVSCGSEGIATSIATKAAKTAIQPMVDNALQGINQDDAQDLITNRQQELIELAVTKFINDPEVSAMPIGDRAHGAILAAANELLAQAPADQG